MSSKLGSESSSREHTPSPLFKTPGKAGLLSHLYQLNHTPDGGLNWKKQVTSQGYASSSPESNCQPFSSPESGTRYASLNTGTPRSETPQQSSSRVPRNPFDHVMLSQLHQATFSPSVFSKSSTPSGDERTPRGFCWSIDQMAILHPADIDEMVDQHHEFHDHETEEKAQKVINQFFSSQLVAPSPSPCQQEKGQTAVDGHSGNCSVKLDSVNKGETRWHNQQSSNAVSSAGKDAACQTLLSIPVNFDLQKILGEFFMNTEENLQDSLSTSTLRRKLFFQGELDTPYSSPVKSKNAMVCDSPRTYNGMVSAFNCATPEQQKVNSDTAQFSSSPIVYLKSTDVSAVSHNSPFGYLTSPELSPICSSKFKTPSTGSSVRSGPFVLPCTPSCVPLQATPSSGRQTIPSTSPDVSPISFDHGQNSQKSGKSSPVQSLMFHDDLEDDKNKDSSECNENTNEVDQLSSEMLQYSSSSPFIISPHAGTSPERSSTPTERDNIYGTNLCKSVEDVENIPRNELSTKSTEEKIQYTNNMLFGTGQLSAIRENYSTMDMDVGLNSTNQDTGYQTCSLQIITQDTRSLSNLTNHEAQCIMRDLTNQDEGYTNYSMLAADHPSMHTDITAQLNNLPMAGYGNDTGMGLSLVSEKKQQFEYRQAFDKENVCPTTITMDTESESDKNHILQQAKQDFERPDFQGILADHNKIPFLHEGNKNSVSLNINYSGNNEYNTDVNSRKIEFVQGTGGFRSEQQFAWEPIGSSTPSISRMHMAQTEYQQIDTGPEEQPFSVIATQVMKRAESDYRMYCTGYVRNKDDMTL